jgi:general secretion pathway protein E/type IV pilus assembly protein PilB
MHGIGCDTCGGLGFRGRKGIFELFTVNEEMEEMIYSNSTLVEIRTKAREMGMRNMREDGMRKVLAGITTLEEILRVTVEEG